MVMMYLGFIDVTFVTLNLVSNKESPVSLPNFQMAPRLKILKPSGSKKGTQIYFFFFSHKSWQTNCIHVPQQGPYGERYLFTGDFCISVVTRTKIPLNNNFFPSKSPVY